MPIITKNTITYNETDFLAGLHPQYGSKTIPQKFGKFSRSQYNFNAFNDLGYAKNGFLGVDFENEELVTSRIIKIIRGSDNYHYSIDSKDLVHRLINAGSSSSEVDLSVVFPYTVSPHAGHTDVVLSDIVEHYSSNSKIASIFYSWNDNVDGDVGVIYIAGGADQDFMSARPSGKERLAVAYPHPLCVGHDDKLYIGNGRYLYSYDYSDTINTDGLLTANVLTLPEGYVIKSIKKLQPRSLVIFAQKGTYGAGEDAKAFFWDYLSLDPYQVESLYDNEIITTFEYKGTLGCFVYSNLDEKNIKVFNGSEFITLTRIKKQFTNSDVLPSIGCIDVVDNEIYIHTSDQLYGFIYKYGNNYNLENKLSLVGKSIAGISGYNSGAIKYTPQYDTFIVSTGLDDATSATIQYLDKSKYAVDGFWYSDLTDIGYERIQITGITVYFADEFTGGRTISLSLTDRYNTYAISGLTNLATVTPTNRIYRAKPILNTAGTPIPPLDGVGINLEWGSGSGSSVTPIINKVVLNYEPIKIN